MTNSGDKFKKSPFGSWGGWRELQRCRRQFLFLLVCVLFHHQTHLSCQWQVWLCEQIPVAGAENTSVEVLLPSLWSSGVFKATPTVESGADLLGIWQMLDPLWKWRNQNVPVRFWMNQAFCAWPGSFFLSRRFLRWAMPPRPRSSATTPATTSSPGWCPQTHTRPRPWWTLSKPCAGTTSPPWPQRETTGRAAWMPSSRSPEKTVSISLNFDCFDYFIIISQKHFSSLCVSVRMLLSCDWAGCFC